MSHRNWARLFQTLESSKGKRRRGKLRAALKSWVWAWRRVGAPRWAQGRALSSLKSFSPPGGQVGSWGFCIPSVDGRRCFQSRFGISGAFPAKEECPGFGVWGSGCAFSPRQWEARASAGELGLVSLTSRDGGSRCRFLSFFPLSPELSVLSPPSGPFCSCLGNYCHSTTESSVITATVKIRSMFGGRTS